MSKNRKKIRKGGTCLSVMLLASIACLLLNNIIYVHPHELPDGTVVFHAHPYNKTAEETDSGSKHHHTRDELLQIHSINHSDYLAPDENTILTESIHLCFNQVFFSQEYDCACDHVPSLRAPPLLS